MLYRWAALCAVTAGCGGSAARGTGTLAAADIRIVASVATETWYASPTSCGQGPYELEVPIGDSRWGEEIELRIAAPRRIALHATVLADGAEVARTVDVFDASGRGRGKPDNARCVAGARERHAAVAGGGGDAGGEGDGGGDVPVIPGDTTAPPAATVPLALVPGEPPARAHDVVRFGWRERDQRAGRIRIRLWSIEPNDLEGVRFGVTRYVFRPNVPEAEYEAHLARLADAQRRRDAEARRRHLAAQRARPPVTVAIDVRAEEARRRREEEQARARAAARLRKAEEDARRHAIELARRAERERRRAAFCASHPEDRECWGAGGRAVYLQLEARGRERDAYCAATPEDARCWSEAERARRRLAWGARVSAALAPPTQPDGPPPAPLAEDVPPKLSVNAEWRPGYWLWTGATWTWLAGMWRVPEADIVAELTTTAPAAPPAPRVEVIPPPPMATTVWVEGFWQWNGHTWIWVAGSYQARPEAGVVWRPTAWRPRGRVHVLIPGGWVPRAGGRR